MNIHALQRSLPLLLIICLSLVEMTALGKRRPPPGGRLGIVVDERLSALRATPDLSGRLLRRIGRGGLVAVRSEMRNRGVVVFYKVNINSRTSGWLQRDAIVSPGRSGDDARLLQLIKGSDDFDRIARARIFLDNFRQSEFRPEVLMIYAEAAEEAAIHLSRDASRRLNEKEMSGGGAPVFSYFLNFNGLDRYNRQGLSFIFDVHEKRFHYDGESWQEIVHRYPQSPEAAAARKKLASIKGS